MSARISFIAKVGVVCMVIFWFIQGRPPAKAQHRQPMVVATEGMVSVTDDAQNRSIDKIAGQLNEFQKNQESWNKQTGAQVADALTTSHSLNDKLLGGLGLIGLFTSIATVAQFFQFRRSKS